MGDAMLGVTLHYSPTVEWQRLRMVDFCSGLAALGISVEVTSSRERISDRPAILFGTTFWRAIESVPGDWLLVDRASYGDPDYVQLVWNGHGRRGDHCVPWDYDNSRWDANPQPFLPERKASDCTARVICAQTEPYCPQWPSIYAWYDSVKNATHYRPHPAEHQSMARLPIRTDFADAEAIVLNSSIGVPCVFDGVPLDVRDPHGAMCGNVWSDYGNDRTAWAHWLAWTQWRWDEIRSGNPISHLFDRFD